jgi:hypothetical protein
VSIPTIKRLEAHNGALGGRHETGTKIRLALEKAGVEHLVEIALAAKPRDSTPTKNSRSTNN